jgi:hypothetical protein
MPLTITQRYAVTFSLSALAIGTFSFWYGSQMPYVVEHNTTDAVEESLAVNLPPQNFYERCRELTRLEKLSYAFTSSVPVQFNVHYHEGGKDYYPLGQEDATEGGGIFEPSAARIYCLMWGNNASEPSRLEYQFQVVPQNP